MTEETEVPPECFDPRGDVCCFRCAPREESVITPATREWESVQAAYIQHAGKANHTEKVALCVLGPDDKVHAWMPQ